MLILFALIVGAVVGIALHLLLPHRASRGAAVAPVLATAVAGATYTALTWLGLAESNPWLWVASLLAPVVVTALVVVFFARARVAHDERERVRLRIA